MRIYNDNNWKAGQQNGTKVMYSKRKESCAVQSGSRGSPLLTVPMCLTLIPPPHTHNAPAHFCYDRFENDSIYIRHVHID